MKEHQVIARSKVLSYQVDFHLDLETAKLLAIKECKAIIDYIETKSKLRKDTDFYNNIINEIESI